MYRMIGYFRRCLGSLRFCGRHMCSYYAKSVVYRHKMSLKVLILGERLHAMILIIGSMFFCRSGLGGAQSSILVMCVLQIFSLNRFNQRRSKYLIELSLQEKHTHEEMRTKEII